MIPDLSQLSLDELNAVITQAQSLIVARKDDDLNKAYAEIVSRAAELGVTLDELVAQGAKVAKKAPASSKKPVAVRFRNPDDASETWTGRGKQPRWLAAKLAAGQPLESFAVA